ncbi:MBL fold metallo-hydrolase [Haloechinothrix sp. LS1_15]|uniref:MBL fold metallo-hydrolase n=1 Tax=Haloechinothrix sp. LS1_15 TaxID=2652248 RepID=UPI00294897DC|nr:MBL fold metallo-hydrolase [Haloechinothrix sp. LS1_15]MDV6013314.1 MBL fold metallo-hydrolase [Haloechinothrix sp. LS1_15]
MLVAGFAAGVFQANCYVIAGGEGADCVIVDPGQDAAEPVGRTLREHRLNPVAVLATHGHVDHVYSAATIADAHTIPAYIERLDRELLSDPLKGLGPQLAEQLAAIFPRQQALREPQEVVELGEGPLDVAGLRVEVDLTPGHTPGSVTYRLSTEEGGRLALTGDTLFAGSIGRTDLPGGDMDQLRRSLREKVLTLPDETVVLPGHGGTTTIGRERAANPFLAGLHAAPVTGT